VTQGTHYRAQQFIDAIPNSGGIITAIAQRVGCSWHTAQKYIVAMPTVAQAYQDEVEKVGDLAETTLIKSIRDGDVSSAKFYLTTKARHRGYVMKTETEITGKDGGALVVEYVNDWRPNNPTVPAQWPADSEAPGEALQLAGSGAQVAQDNTGHDNSSREGG